MDVLRSEAIRADSAASACPALLLLRPAASCRARGTGVQNVLVHVHHGGGDARTDQGCRDTGAHLAGSQHSRAKGHRLHVSSTPLGTGRPRPGGPGRSGLGREEDDLDPARRKLCQGGILQAQDLGAEADRGDLARSEPAGRVDSVLRDQVLAYGVGLLLGQDLGKVDVVVIVGEGGDDDLRLWLAGLLAPAPDLVEAGAADRCQDARPGSNSSSSRNKRLSRREPGWYRTFSRSKKERESE